MNRLVAQMLPPRWVAPVLLVIAAVSAAIVVSVRGVVVSTTIAIRTGAPVPCGPARQATGGMRRGWPPAVLVRARGPPAQGAGSRCRVPVSSSASALLFVTFIKPAAAGAAPVADMTVSPDRRPDPGGSPLPTDKESNDAITQSERSGRQPVAAAASRTSDDVERP